MPGGVNSPVRAFRAVGGTPVFVRAATGAFLHTEDGRRLTDYVGSWGPMLLGHAHPAIVDAVSAALRDGTSFGAPTERETLLAEAVVRMVPGMEMVRFVSSGTEGCASAIRLARGATGRRLVVKCAGCYHGSVDPLLVRAGSGVATFSLPDCAGVTPACAAETLVVEFNDRAALSDLFAARGDEVAAFILEPVPGNMGLVPPRPGYLELARRVTREAGAVLVFDEVMTGFRLAPGGAQELFGVTPDMTVLGKIVGGGLPVAAFGGRRDLMEQLAPDGPVYQAGTLSGNPLGMAAGLAMLREIERLAGALYADLDSRTGDLCEGLSRALRGAGIPHVVQRCGSMFTVFFTEDAVACHADAARCDRSRFARWFHAMLERGVYLPPSQFESAFVSAAHGAEEIAATLEAAAAAAEAVA